MQIICDKCKAEIHPQPETIRNGKIEHIFFRCPECGESYHLCAIIIRFDHAVPEDKKDPELMDKFRAEADGIFLFALEGLKRLMSNKFKFSETQANRDELEKYRTDSDSVLSFVRDCCVVGNPQDEVGSTELYIAYKNYCEECGMKPYAQNKFVIQISDAHPGVKRDKDRTGKRRIPFAAAILWKCIGYAGNAKTFTGCRQGNAYSGSIVTRRAALSAGGEGSPAGSRYRFAYFAYTLRVYGVCMRESMHEQCLLLCFLDLPCV